MATLAAQLVRDARRASGLSQAALARYSQIDQSAVSRYEQGRHDPTLDTLTALLSSAGTRLVPVASRYPTVADVASEISEFARVSFEKAYRSFLVANDSLRSESPLNRVLLSAGRPVLTGEATLDAALAGIVEHYLGQDGSPLPDWVAEPERFLTSRWYVDDSRYGREHDPAQTPAALLRRGVILPAEGLDSA